MIVKVQRPLNASGPYALWLVYNKSGRFMAQMPEMNVHVNVIKAMGLDAKAYFVASFDKKAKLLNFERRVKNRNW